MNQTKKIIVGAILGIGLTLGVGFNKNNLDNYVTKIWEQEVKSCQQNQRRISGNLQNYIIWGHGGILKSGNNRDYDGDNINDLYLECKDKSIISKLSSKNYIGWYDLGKR